MGQRLGGRQKGTPNKATAAKAAAIAQSGLTPLEFMLNRMREPEPVPKADEDMALFVERYMAWRADGLDAAKAAAPYVHPKLANIEHTGKDGGPIQIEYTL